jgi:pimeloyl-ACP methyl ester carboxylesterase
VLDIIAAYTFSPQWLDSNHQMFEARRAQFQALPPDWYRGLEGLLSSLEQLDLRPSLGRVTAPTLVLGAECDRLFPVARSQALARGIRHATLRIVPGAAHGWVAEDPGGVVAHILPFLLQHSSRGVS